MEDGNLNISFLNLPQKQVYVDVYKDGEQIDAFKLGKDLSIQKRLSYNFV